MSTTTPNIGLTIPTGTENVSRQIINGNNTLIDTAVGSINEQIGTWQVITETKTTGATGNIALDAVANGKQFIISPHAVGNDAFLRLWRATSNGIWYLTAVNPNTGATINSTELEIRYLKITLP